MWYRGCKGLLGVQILPGCCSQHLHLHSSFIWDCLNIVHSHCIYTLYPQQYHDTCWQTSIGGSKGGRQGRAPPPPPLGPNSFIFMQFLGKFGQNNRLAPPPWGLAPPRLGNPGSATDKGRWFDKSALDQLMPKRPDPYILFGINN